MPHPPVIASRIVLATAMDTNLADMIKADPAPVERPSGAAPDACPHTGEVDRPEEQAARRPELTGDRAGNGAARRSEPAGWARGPARGPPRPVVRRGITPGRQYRLVAAPVEVRLALGGAEARPAKGTPRRHARRRPTAPRCSTTIRSSRSSAQSTSASFRGAPHRASRARQRDGRGLADPRELSRANGETGQRAGVARPANDRSCRSSRRICSWPTSRSGSPNCRPMHVYNPAPMARHPDWRTVSDRCVAVYHYVGVPTPRYRQRPGPEAGRPVVPGAFRDHGSGPPDPADQCEE